MHSNLFWFIKKHQWASQKKVFEHARTKAHLAAEGILDKAKSDPVVQLIVNSRSQQMATTTRVFCTAYKEAKCHKPTNGLEYVIDCQELNGVYTHSNVVHANIQKHISGMK